MLSTSRITVLNLDSIFSLKRNILFCLRCYSFNVADVLTNNSRFMSDTIYSCARTEVTDVQMHEVGLLSECVLIRDGLTTLPCWFLKTDVLIIYAPC